MDFISTAVSWVVEHPIEIGVGWFLADKAVELTPWTQDDKIVAALRKILRRVTGRDPGDVVH